MLKQQTPLSLDEKYVLYDVESLFTNIPVDETIPTSLMKFTRRISYHKYAVKQYSKDCYIS